jgi:hypothetical protein
VDSEKINPGVDIASFLSQVTSNKAIVTILISREDAIEIRDLKFAVTNWIEQFSVHKVNSRIPDNNESVLSRKEGARKHTRTEHMTESNKKLFWKSVMASAIYFIWKEINCSTVI